MKTRLLNKITEMLENNAEKIMEAQIKFAEEYDYKFFLESIKLKTDQKTLLELLKIVINQREGIFLKDLEENFEEKLKKFKIELIEKELEEYEQENKNL